LIGEVVNYRDPDANTDLHLFIDGAEITDCVSDLKDADSVHAACRGVDAVVTTANAIGRTGDDNLDSVDHLGNRNLVDAAEAEGVRRFVCISALGAHPDHPMPLLRAKGRTVFINQFGPRLSNKFGPHSWSPPKQLGRREVQLNAGSVARLPVIEVGPKQVDAPGPEHVDGNTTRA
jgi:hypothetical protein